MEHVEEDIVYGKSSGVIISKSTFGHVLDLNAPWVPLEGTKPTGFVPVGAEFNQRGSFLAVSHSAGTVDLWSFVAAPLKCRTLVLPDRIAGLADHTEASAAEVLRVCAACMAAAALASSMTCDGSDA